METYSHLYPNKQTEVAAQLDAIATKMMATKIQLM